MSWIQNRKKPIQVDTTQSFSKSQGTVIGKSFGYAALGFVIMAALIAGFTCIWEFAVFNQSWNWNTLNGLNIGLTIGSFVLTITSAILAMFWQQKLLTMQNATVYTFLVWGFFIVGQSLAFSWLIFMLNHTIINGSGGTTLWWICPLAFLIAFVLFGICGLIGYSLSIKGAFTVKKMEMVTSMVFGIIAFPLFIMMFVAIFVPGWLGGLYWIWFLMGFIFVFLLLLSVISIISDIKRSSEFAEMATSGETHNQVVNRLSLIYGFSLLVEFICLVWMLIWLILQVTFLTRRV